MPRHSYTSTLHAHFSAPVHTQPVEVVADQRALRGHALALHRGPEAQKYENV